MTTPLEMIRFLGELALLVGAGVAGGAVSWPVAIIAPLLVVLLWGLFIAPKSTRRLPDPFRLALEAGLFTAVGGSLAASGRIWIGIILAVVSMTVAVLIRRAGSPAGATR